MKYKSGEYSGEKYSDGSLRIWKAGKLIGELYFSVSSNAKHHHFTKKNFESICSAIENSCRPFVEEKS